MHAYDMHVSARARSRAVGAACVAHETACVAHEEQETAFHAFALLHSPLPRMPAYVLWIQEDSGPVKQETGD